MMVMAKEKVKQEMAQKQDKGNLVWVDMEMTGLNPDKEVIIEIATIITNSELEILTEGPDLVIHQPNTYLDAMDDWNKNQHEKTGLTKAVKESNVSLSQAEQQTLEVIHKYCPPKKCLLCGNAVHHDRRFMIKYMPKIHEYLHYRHIDVSTIKSLVSSWYPKDKDLPKKNNTHRALADIRDSIEELKYYRQKYFAKLEDIVSQTKKEEKS